jgi:hypothetical protein
MLKTIRQAFAALAVMLVAALLPISTQAGPTELALLESYVGSWAGSGALVGGEQPERFTCRLRISKGNQSKINYAGRCSLVSMNISVSGTILYDDGAGRYQAVMSSNVGFKGNAVGRRSGDRIVFDLASQQVDRGGNQIRIGAVITLEGGDIAVDFEVEFNNSGQILTAKVPFSRA